ncbi:transferrin 3 [Leptinotarsa decemlineata]|uniref:transferrin 3 n=1 Tax=Leptinotarsa decemlineata TaxID=7539 RepID=UPI003D307F9D
MVSFGPITTCSIVALSILSFVYCDKYRLCVVDGKGHFKRSQRYCPQLDMAVDSKVDCIVAPDRSDCLRKILKGKADFSVFAPEDLITASSEGVQLLVTNELRYINEEHEYEVVAVIDNNSEIKSRHDLGGKKFCHPGYGYETDWTRILSNFFEASVVTPSCDPHLTLSENRIKATAEFFQSACKAGPWVNDPVLDNQLKEKYPQLCELCGSPGRCTTHDKYWGRRGSLLCLTDGAGDISWARLDDVKSHFGLVAGSAEATPERYSFLCPDDSIIPVNSSKPCVWVVKPWPVVAAKREKADEIQKLVSSLSHKDQNTWKFSLLNLIETSYTNFFKLPTLEPIESYLDRATGYLSANSFSGCHPPRTIRICTTSIIENAKCSWMRESAGVYGVEPDLECIKADNTTHCMMAINMNAADVVMVPPDMVHEAVEKYNLKTLFYETVLESEKYLTVAVTRQGANINSFEDFRGKKACFPVYDGVAWNTVKNTLFSKKLIKYCPLDQEMASFFGPSCTPGLPEKEGGNLKKLCQQEDFNGEFGALHCLSSEAGDVAFVSKNSIRKFTSDESEGNPGNRLSMDDFQILCEGNSKNCHLSWASAAQAMIRSNSSDLWMKDSLDVFLQLDGLFGKNFKFLTNPFTMFGQYDGKSNLLFQDSTQRLRNRPNARDTDTMPYFYNFTLKTDDYCTIRSSSSNLSPTYLYIFIAFIYLSKLVHIGI